jgi:hypothetical protein
VKTSAVGAKVVSAKTQTATHEQDDRGDHCGTWVDITRHILVVTGPFTSQHRKQAHKRSPWPRVKLFPLFQCACGKLPFFRLLAPLQPPMYGWRVAQEKQTQDNAYEKEEIAQIGRRS